MKLRVFDTIAIPPPKKKVKCRARKILFLFNFADFFSNSQTNEIK